MSLSIALGDHLPANDTEFNALDPVFKGVLSQTDNQSRWFITSVSVMRVPQLKMPIRPSGRRFVIRVTHANAANRAVTCGLVISKIPSSIPEWLNF